MRHYGYYLAPAEMQAHLWNLCTSALFIVALSYVALKIGGWLVWPAGWWIAEEAMVSVCTSLYLVKPWGAGDQCSSLLGSNVLALIGCAIMAGLSLHLASRANPTR